MTEKRVCDGCKFFHENASQTREWCYVASEYSRLKNREKDYVNERMNGNESHCRFYKKIEA